MGSPVFLIWIVLIGFMFYFLMIRPQKRARSQQSSMLDHLKPGAQVRTTAQIMGTVVEVGDDWAIVETTPGTRIKFGKPAIVGIILDDAEETEESEETESAEGAEGAEGAEATAAVEDAPTPGGIGDAPHSVQDAVPAQDAVKAGTEADEAADAAQDAEAAKDAEPAAKS